MADYVQKLRDDLVEQFKGKPVIDALMEAVGDVGVRVDCSRGNVHDVTPPFRYFSFLGFTGNRLGWLRGGARQRKNCGSDF